MECSVCGEYTENSYVLEEPGYGDSYFLCSFICIGEWLKKQIEQEGEENGRNDLE